MRRFLFLLLLVAVPYVLNAQELPESTNKKIKPVPETESGGSLLFPENEESTVLKRPKKEPKINLRQETDLTDPGIKFKEKTKLKQDAPMGPGFVSDTFLGEIRTGETIIKLMCRDHGYQDGDLVRIWVDDKVVIEKIYLKYAYQGVRIPLKQGFNKIEIEALNQGESGPNTAEFVVMNDKGEVIQKNEWNLASGVKALLVVLKE